MANSKKEIVPGLTTADIKIITNQVISRIDGNHPQLKISGNGFINILQNGKPDISTSCAIVKKAKL